MNEKQVTETERKSRLRWITLGEAIAISAVIISAAGVWISWESSNSDKGPTTVVEKREAVPLALRGKPLDEGRSLEISPVEDGHALQSLNIVVDKSSTVDVGSDGELSAADLESALGDKAEEGKGTHRLQVRIDARYVEAGADKSSTGSYVISYRWEGGGLLGGRALRITGMSKG